jgi:hypothetical protein
MGFCLLFIRINLLLSIVLSILILSLVVLDSLFETWLDHIDIVATFRIWYFSNQVAF